MFRSPILMVDDDQAYLDQLNRAFSLSGLPCLPILFIGDDPNNESGIDHISADTAHARIIALDINLKEQPDPRDAKQLYTTIEAVLEKIQPKGPYYLLFWSRYKDLPNEIIALLASRSSEIISAPIGWGYLDKTEFQGQDDAMELKSKLLDLISDDKMFHLLLEWEERAGRAASSTLSELYSIAAIPHQNGWQFDETRSKFSDLITHISHQSVGHKNAQNSINHSIETGLLPIIEDRLVALSTDEEVEGLDERWGACLEHIGKPSDLQGLSEDEIAILNSFYNIEEVPEDFSMTKRGVFSQVAENIFTESDKFEGVFGKHEEGLLSIVKDEFVVRSKKSVINELIDSSLFGWLEVGAACDHAQVKNKLHRYLFGMLIPEKYSDYLYKDDRDIKDRVHEGIYRSPTLRYKDENYVIFFSFRYQIGAHGDNEALGKPLFRMRDHLVSEIAFTWSKHSIRPGITSFR